MMFSGIRGNALLRVLGNIGAKRSLASWRMLKRCYCQTELTIRHLTELRGCADTHLSLYWV